MSKSGKKARYRSILYRLEIINNSMPGLTNSLGAVQNTMKKALVINDKAYENARIETMKSNSNSVNYTISHYLIPSLYSKI